MKLHVALLFFITLCAAALLSVQAAPVAAEDAGSDAQATQDSGAGSSDASSDDEDISLGEVEVTGSKIGQTLKDVPTTTEIIDAKEIRESGAEDLLDLLRRKVGMNEVDIFGGTSVGLLGLPAKFTLVLIDGQRITGRVFDQLDFNQLPLSAVERIEVIKGPSSTLYGSEAIGGVVNIITKKPGEGLSGELRGKAGSFGLADEGFGIGWAEGGKSFLLDYDRFHYDGFDLDARTIDSDGDREDHDSVFAKYRLGMGASSRLDFTGIYFKEQRRSVRFAPPDIVKNGDTGTRRLELALNYEWNVTPSEVFRLGVHEGRFDHGFTSYFVGFDPSTATETAFFETALDYEAEYAWYKDRNIVLAGVKRVSDDIESDRVAGGGANYDTNVLYVQHEYKPSSMLTWIWGARLDDNSSYGSRISPKFGFKYSPAANVDVRGSVSRGFRAPGLRELYFDFNSPFGYRVEGNTNLSPETSTGYQVSVDATPARHSQARLILFRNEVNNLISAVEVSRAPWVFREENIENAMSQGVELALGQKLSPDWTLSYSGLWTDSSDEETGNRLPNSPVWDHRVSLGFAHDRIGAEAFLRSTSSRFTDLANATVAPGFTTVDLHFSYKLKDWDLKLHLLNITDEVNRKYGPKPGFEWQVEAVWNFS